MSVAIAAPAGLGERFSAGTPPQDLDGMARGTFIALDVARPLDALGSLVARAWMPWLGKRFDAAAAGGANLLRPSARVPFKLLWPRLSLRPDPAGLAGVDFETRVEPGLVAPQVDVLAIDYAAVAANPRLIIGSIRDELVETAPGVYLGRILWRRRSGAHAHIGWFGLET